MASKTYRVAKLKYPDDLLKNFDSLNWQRTVESDSIEDAVEQVAQKAYDDCENENPDTWPLTFLVASPDGNVTKVEVEAEFEPTFWAEIIEENVAHLS